MVQRETGVILWIKKQGGMGVLDGGLTRIITTWKNLEVAAPIGVSPLLHCM
jgi:hypothetical protein